ncbi:transcriptional regulator domain-containing protein [Xylophilus sp. ASV27]|uniref:transcriptional regulator domain-containing protein n=1 Tax=Xylophilus sp. ASV27 TaxID=2795129 RepID=UPI001E57EAD9|nr:DUF6499 domain-containing protein [Xylophilus sp. ASV27]
MTIPFDDDASTAPWSAGAAYLYTLALDGPALAWEYLRRHPGYREAWRRGRLKGRIRAASRWGLRCCRRSVARRA